jgi:large subunit ribosomal protein L4
MELEVFKKDGTESGEKIALSAGIFGITPNDHAIYQAVRSFLANQRQGTHKTKTHGEVSGSGKKLWKQKHTGRARMGSVRSPLWKGGGAIFGPLPRDYTMELPKQMKQLARKSALSHKAAANNIKVVEDFTFEVPKTKELCTILKALGLDQKKVLLLTPASDANVHKSGRNISRFKVLEARKASTYELVDNEVLLLQKSAVQALEKTFQES